MVPLYLVFKSIMRLNLDYCMESALQEVYMDRLEKVQRRTTKMVEGQKSYSYVDFNLTVGLTVV